jgi:hypothetical protein
MAEAEARYRKIGEEPSFAPKRQRSVGRSRTLETA